MQEVSGLQDPALTRPHTIRPPGDEAADFRIILGGVYYALLRP